MSYADAVDHLYALSGELAPSPGGAPRRKFELEHMRVLASALGNPQDRFPSVLIAGTNGKGSTAATLASILSVSGYRTGLYTSPHLVRINERVQISSGVAGSNSLREMEDDAFARLYFHVDDVARALVLEYKLPHAPSFFEVMTAIAFLAFAEAGVQIAVLEVGLGGRLDATNIVSPSVSVITDIALDHTEWLGSTLTEIAREKAGILRRDGVLVTLPQHPEANYAIGEVAMALNVTGVNAAEYLPGRSAGGGAYEVSLGGSPVIVDTPLHGEHQQRNVALAVAASAYLTDSKGLNAISAKTVSDGIRLTRWPGRLEALPRRCGDGLLLVDVAHNPAGAWTLRSYLSRAIDEGHLPGPRTLLFSALRDKAVLEMAKILFPLFDEPGDRILLAPVNSARASSTEQLSAIAAELETNATPCDSVDQAMAQAESIPGGSIVASGSVYLVGEVKQWLQRGKA